VVLACLLENYVPFVTSTSAPNRVLDAWVCRTVAVLALNEVDTAIMHDQDRK
jgi:hypothetical protein